MIGWHYTTWENWLKIKEEGLKPYPIVKPEFKATFGTDTMHGVWIWRHRFNGRSHFGSIMYQMAYKDSDDIVILEVDYDEATICAVPQGRISLTHTGNINNYNYHDGSEKSWVIACCIPPQSIRVFRRYNIKGLVELYDEVLDKEQQGEGDGFRFHCSGRNVITRDRRSVEEPRAIEASETLSRSR